MKELTWNSNAETSGELTLLEKQEGKSSVGTEERETEEYLRMRKTLRDSPLGEEGWELTQNV